MARPRQFDNQEVLTAAQDVFWEKGYNAASTRDLTQAMRMTTASLYNAFGDKRALFLATLDRYVDLSLRERMTRLESTAAPAEAITGFFTESIRRSLDDRQDRGCMLVNTALEARPEEPEIRRMVAAQTDEMEAFFARAARAAQADGVIKPDVNVADVGRHLLSLALGLRVLARIRPERELLIGLVRPALAHLGLPPLLEDEI